MELTLCTSRLFLLLCLLLDGYLVLPSEQSTYDNSYGTAASSSGKLPEPDPQQSRTKYQNTPQESARIFFNFLGDIISSVPFLPIELNIPDTIGQAVEYIGSWFTGNSQGGGSQEEVLQRELIDGILYLFSKENSE